ncbi:MAG TPA: hypothetical protein VG308_11120 [Stellaceae bacterium]|jgi:hypothetical protein|nr:hypothetical protein [Stellaceae bacterium]
MSKLGAMFLTGTILVAIPLAAAPPPVEVAPAPAAAAPHHIGRSAAWGCRDKGELIDLLFLGLSTSFDLKLSSALAEGRCAYFTDGEGVTIVESSGHGLVKVKVERAGAAPEIYWTPLRNVE